jgi:hypothetical protein
MVWSFTVDMPSIKGRPQTPYRISRLLGESNAKLSKSDAAGINILTYGLSLAPSKASGFNLCSHASAGCIKGCLYNSGHAQIYPRAILPARIAKSRLLRKHPDIFRDRLMVELNSAVRRAAKLQARLFVRLNVYSDVEWENEAPEIFNSFPNIQFYDYTKGYDRIARFIGQAGDFPSNYHLTFSRSENNWSDCLAVLNAGQNVAVPFHIKRSKPLPTMFEGFEVINGDLTDLRPLDAKGKIVGLRVKGSKAKADFSSGFVINIGEANRRVA